MLDLNNGDQSLHDCAQREHEKQPMNKGFMTPEQINIECAKLDGWKFVYKPATACSCEEYRVFYYETELGGFDVCKGWKHCFDVFEIPSYPFSYDAIIPLIQKQPYEVRFSIAMSAPDGRMSFMSTPLELCIALLKAKGLYVEQL